MPIEWYYRAMGEEIGPLSSSALKEKAAIGHIQPDSFVRKGRDGRWVSAWCVKGLFDKSKKPHAETTGEPLHPSVLIQESPPPPITTADVAMEEVDSVPASIDIPESQPATKRSELSSRPPPNRKKPKHQKWIIAALVIIVAIPAYSWIRNDGLRSKLKSCETYGVVEADVYYDGMFGNDVVVFDLKDGSSYGARRIDPVHLFLQFASKLDLYFVRHVILARNGRHVFYLYASDLRRLADSYDGGGRIWAFNHLPESCHTMSGLRAYSEWTGGWLGVLQKQTEDLSDFIKTWTVY